MNIKTDTKPDIYIVVNPKSGSYSDSTYFDILTNLKQYLPDHVITNIDSKNDNSTSTVTKRMIEFKTIYINHALHVFSQLSLKDISTIDLIIIIGGDGIIHEVVNGLFTNSNNEAWLNIFPPMCICPLGSGNHLARLVGTGTIDSFYEAIKTFATGDVVQKLILPNMVESNPNLSNRSPYTITFNTLDKKNKYTLSINTIIAGTPAVINEKASDVAEYLPRIISPLKYDLGSVFGIFTREYLIVNVKNDNNVLDIINNVVGIFIQITPSCANNFIVDSRINGSESGLSYAYIKDVGTAKLIYEFTKERVGYKSDEFIREYNTDNELILDSYIDAKTPTLTIDGQSEKIQLPVTIKKYYHSLKFLSPCASYELTMVDFDLG